MFVNPGLRLVQFGWANNQIPLCKQEQEKFFKTWYEELNLELLTSGSATCGWQALDHIFAWKSEKSDGTHRQENSVVTCSGPVMPWGSAQDPVIRYGLSDHCWQGIVWWHPIWLDELGFALTIFDDTSTNIDIARIARCPNESLVCGQFPLWESTATRKRSSSICVWKLVAWGSWKLWAACWQNLESCKWKGSEIMSSWFQVVKNSLGSFWFWDCVAIPSSSQAESTPFNDFGSDFSNFSSGFLQLDSSMSPVWSRCEAKKVPITKLPRRRWCAVVWFQHWCPRGWEQLAKQERTLNQWYETVL